MNNFNKKYDELYADIEKLEWQMTILINQYQIKLQDLKQLILQCKMNLK